MIFKWVLFHDFHSMLLQDLQSFQEELMDFLFSIVIHNISIDAFWERLHNEHLQSKNEKDILNECMLTTKY